MILPGQNPPPEDELSIYIGENFETGNSYRKFPISYQNNRFGLFVQEFSKILIVNLKKDSGLLAEDENFIPNDPKEDRFC